MLLCVADMRSAVYLVISRYTDEKAADKKEATKMAIRALLEVVQSGSKSIELAEMTADGGFRSVTTLCDTLLSLSLPPSPSLVVG